MSQQRAEVVKLFVGQIPKTLEEDGVREVFQEFGEITEVVILRDRRTGMHQGCCFVKYTTLAAAKAAMQTLHNQRSLPPLRNPLQVRLADSGGNTGDRGQTNAENKLFVGGVPGGCGDKDLRALFSNYGEVLDVYILASKASQEGQRGCAFVRYASPQSCAIAIEALHGKYAMKTGELPLVVRFADPPKNQRGSANAYGGNNAANGRFPWGAGAPPVWPAGPPPPGWPMPWAAMGMGPYAPWVMPPGMTAPQNGTTPYGFYGYGAQQPQVGQPPQQQFGATSPPPPPDNPTGAPPLPPQPAPAQSPAQAWTEHQTPEGLKYYYNNTTGTSSWECPPELRPAQQPSSSAALQSVNALAPAMAALNVSTSSAMGAFSAGGPATSGAMNGMGSYQNSSSLVGSGALGSLPSLSNGSLNGRGGGMDGLGMGGLPGLNTLGASQPPASSSVMSQELSNGFQQEVQLPHFLNEGASSSGRGGYESSLSGSQGIDIPSMTGLNL